MIIPFLANRATLCGGGTRLWYFNLGDPGRKEADAAADEIARELHGVSVDQLTFAQANQVHNLVRRRLVK